MHASDDPIADAPDGVGRLRRVPQVGEHVHAAPLDLGGLRVLVLVDHVLVDRQVHQPVDLRLLPRLAERGQVLAGVAVEHQLVGDDGEGVLGAPLVRREAVLRRRLGQVVAGVDGVVERRADGLTGVQGHGASQRIERSQPLQPTVRDAAPPRIAPIGGCACVPTRLLIAGPSVSGRTTVGVVLPDTKVSFGRDQRGRGRSRTKSSSRKSATLGSHTSLTNARWSG